MAQKYDARLSQLNHFVGVGFCLGMHIFHFQFAFWIIHFVSWIIEAHNEYPIALADIFSGFVLVLHLIDFNFVTVRFDNSIIPKSDRDRGLISCTCCLLLCVLTALQNPCHLL